MGESFVDSLYFILFNELMLTQRDLNEIESVVDERLEERTSNLPTKDEFFTKMDGVMGELKAIREENAVLTKLQSKVNNHEDRIIKVEKKLRIQPAV